MALISCTFDWLNYNVFAEVPSRTIDRRCIFVGLAVAEILHWDVRNAEPHQFPPS